MSKTAKIAGNPEVDPTLPKIEIKLDGKSYFLCFTFEALAMAQAKLRAQGITVNLLHALDLSNMDAERVVPLLYAALMTHKADITPVQVAKMVTLRNLGTIFEGIAQAYGASLAAPSPEEVKSDPPEAE